jgi:hypothetical protein
MPNKDDFDSSDTPPETTEPAAPTSPDKTELDTRSFTEPTRPAPASPSKTGVRSVE